MSRTEYPVRVLARLCSTCTRQATPEFTSLGTQTIQSPATCVASSTPSASLLSSSSTLSSSPRGCGSTPTLSTGTTTQVKPAPASTCHPNLQLLCSQAARCAALPPGSPALPSCHPSLRPPPSPTQRHRRVPPRETAVPQAGLSAESSSIGHCPSSMNFCPDPSPKGHSHSTASRGKPTLQASHSSRQQLPPTLPPSHHSMHTMDAEYMLGAEFEAWSLQQARPSLFTPTSIFRPSSTQGPAAPSIAGLWVKQAAQQLRASLHPLTQFVRRWQLLEPAAFTPSLARHVTWSRTTTAILATAAVTELVVLPAWAPGGMCGGSLLAEGAAWGLLGTATDLGSLLAGSKDLEQVQAFSLARKLGQVSAGLQRVPSGRCKGRTGLRDSMKDGTGLSLPPCPGHALDACWPHFSLVYLTPDSVMSHCPHTSLAEETCH
ncbi:hypothetical protein V8C86DRAFT_598304 [Haematococcus lacustris]